MSGAEGIGRGRRSLTAVLEFDPRTPRSSKDPEIRDLTQAKVRCLTD